MVLDSHHEGMVQAIDRDPDICPADKRSLKRWIDFAMGGEALRVLLRGVRVDSVLSQLQIIRRKAKDVCGGDEASPGPFGYQPTPSSSSVRYWSALDDACYRLYQMGVDMTLA